MLGDLAIGDAEDIDSDHRFRSPSEIAAVNGDVVALRHNETWLILEVSRKVSQERLDRSGSVWNLWVVLLIVIAEQAVENGGITIDENPLDPRKNQRLVGVGGICLLSTHRHTSMSRCSTKKAVRPVTVGPSALRLTTRLSGSRA